MKKKNYRELYASVIMLLAFILWTIAVRIVDVKAIGPEGSGVGFASINARIHKLTGVHMALYAITDWLGLVPLMFVMAFAVLGLIQWIRRKRLANVDHSILVLGGFYIVVMAVYLLFEMFAVNYRPVLIGGVLEASYPSSTTMLAMCVMPTAIMQLNARIKNKVLKGFVASAIIFFIVFMVIGRLISGVHWFTDIVGGALLSAGLVLMYRAIVRLEIR